MGNRDLQGQRAHKDSAALLAPPAQPESQERQAFQEVPADPEQLELQVRARILYSTRWPKKVVHLSGNKDYVEIFMQLLNILGKLGQCYSAEK